MGIIEWLFYKAPAEHYDAPLPEAYKATGPLPERDDNEVAPVAAEDSIELEEAFTCIDYTDAHGQQTRRRITLRRLARGPHAPLLTAICHERKALRTFRCDRIDGFIEPDGEFLSTEVFFREFFDLELSAFAPSAGQQALQHARRLRDRLRAPLSILVIAALSDRHFHAAELDEIAIWTEREINALAQMGELTEEVNIADLDQLLAITGKMRPSRSSLQGYVETIVETFDENQMQRLVSSLARVIQADGRILPEEIELAEEFDGLRRTREAERAAFFAQLFDGDD